MPYLIFGLCWAAVHGDKVHQLQEAWNNVVPAGAEYVNEVPVSYSSIGCQAPPLSATYTVELATPEPFESSVASHWM